MAHPLNRDQQRQNAAFLERLAQTGNARLAARSLGFNRSIFTKRRARHAGFAQGWDAALTAAHARFHLSGGPRLPQACPERSRRGGARPPASGAVERPDDPKRWAQGLRTQGGEPTIVRRANGKLQLRLALPGRMTSAAEQAFFRALSASANVRLSAAAAGFAHSSFYARRRRRGAFGREMRLALERGYDRLECAALAAGKPESFADDAWRNADPPPLPPMTVSQAIQLLALHQKGVRLSHDQPHRRRRRGESREHYGMRLFLMWRAEQRSYDEERAVARAMQFEGTGEWRLPGEPEAPPPLPPLEEVTGWSKADPTKVPHNPEVPLFGGWRLEDWKKRQAAERKRGER